MYFPWREWFQLHRDADAYTESEPTQVSPPTEKLGDTKASAARVDGRTRSGIVAGWLNRLDLGMKGGKRWTHV
jgi:hypothetical protein